MLELRGLLGFVLFILCVWAIFQIIKSRAEDLHKAIWIGVIVFLPLLGLIVWWFFGPKPEN